MGIPTQKRTKASKRRRAAHFALKKMRLSTCPKCRQQIRPHHACAFCGTYQGREVIKIKIKTKKGQSAKTEKKSKHKQ